MAGLKAVLALIDRLSGALSFGAALALAVLALNIIADVLGRVVFNSPIPGTLEVTAYWWMPMLTLLAYAYTEREQEHIKVTILLDTLPTRMRQIVEGSFGLVAIVLLVFLARHALTEAVDSAEIGQTTSSSPPVAIWPFKFLAVVGIGMLALQIAATTLRNFAGLPLKARDLDNEADVV